MRYDLVPKAFINIKRINCVHVTINIAFTGVSFCVLLNVIIKKTREHF